MKSKFLSTLVIISLIPLLQGCVLAGLGLLGGGGYYVGTKAGKREEERIKTQSLIDVKRELEEKDNAAKAQDQQITNQISQNYLAGELNGGIAVYPEVRNGVVILHGRVPDAATAERAIEAARKTSGVQRIISNLVILNRQAPQPAPQMQPQIPPQYQQQYQQFMQQYQQPPLRSYPQIQYQQPAPGQVPMQSPPPKIKYEQLFNYHPADQKNLYAGAAVVNRDKRSQVANKAQSKQQKQSPPGSDKNNSSVLHPSSSNTSSPKTLPENTVEKLSNDNDSSYKEYHPKVINRNHQQNSTHNDSNRRTPDVIFIPVPVPSYTEDNDNSYRGPGQYNPQPVRGNNNPGMKQHNPVPAPVEDNDFQYYD